MAAPAHPSLLVGAGIAALIAWRIYARVRRMIGRQPLKTVRPWITVVLFPFLAAMLLLVSTAQPMRGGALLAGIAAGVAFGIYGLRLMKFEVTAAGYYTGYAMGLLRWRAAVQAGPASAGEPAPGAQP